MISASPARPRRVAVGQRQFGAVTAVAALGAAVLTGCVHPDRPPGRQPPDADSGAGASAGAAPNHTTSTPPTTVASSGAARSEATDRRAVEEAYRRFWMLEATFDTGSPQPRWALVLAQVAVDPVLTRLVEAAAVQRRNGLRVYGYPLPRPTIPTIGGRTRITLTDCQDDSHTGQADAATGVPRSVGVARTPVVAVLVRAAADGQWRVSDVRYTGGRC